MITTGSPALQPGFQPLTSASAKQPPSGAQPLTAMIQAVQTPSSVVSISPQALALSSATISTIKVGFKPLGIVAAPLRLASLTTDTAAPTVTRFTPGDGSTGAATNANIALTFSENVQRGSGSIVLKNAAGTVIESFDAASSPRISIANNVLTINPTNDLINNTQYFVTFASGTVKDLAGNGYAGTTTYDFTTTLSAFNIDLAYSGDAQYQSYFDQAANFWEKVITGDLPTASGIDDLKISAAVAADDGVGGRLGYASPTQLRGDSSLPFDGTMSFDSADMANMVSNGTLLRVIMHEMGHVLGLGSLWGQPKFSFNTTFGQYTGSNGLDAYRQISGNAGAAYVPLETSTGNPGTDNAHWSEATFKDELMTGFATGAMTLSRMTIGALADLGYQVNYAAAETYTLNLYA